MIDLHTHSNVSDGELEPAALVEKAAALGLTALALTDHDTIAGLEEAELAAKAHGICFIPGVELEIQPELRRDEEENSASDSSAEAPVRAVSGEFHLLGLNFDRQNKEFCACLKYQAEARERRNLEIVEKIRAAGIDVDYDEIKALVNKNVKHSKHFVGRPHFADFLIGRKLAKNHEQAFKRWLGKGRPFYAPKEGLELGKAVRIIHQAGGLAVLAHPMSLYVAWGRLPGLLAFLQKKGIDGIEAWHPNARVKDCKRLEETARALGLLVSAGSDFHGKARPERKLGFTAGGKKIGDEFLDELRNPQKNHPDL
jgi:predicted metal-dependent phosphoesterase TrpH